MENKTHRKGLSEIFSLLPVKSGCMWLTLVAVIINFACVYFLFRLGNVEEAEGGGIMGLQVASSLIMLFASILIGINIGSNYTFVSTIPAKTSKIPLAMSLALDSIFAAVVLSDVVFFIVFGIAKYIPVKLISHLVMYIACHISLYSNVMPGGSKMDPYRLGFISGFTGFIGYFVCTLTNAFVGRFIADGVEYSKNSKLAVTIILAVLVVGAIVTRILSYKGVKSKLRLMKIYKSKKKKTKEESYV